MPDYILPLKFLKISKLSQHYGERLLGRSNVYLSTQSELIKHSDYNTGFLGGSRPNSVT